MQLGVARERTARCARCVYGGLRANAMWANFESSHAANLHCERLTKLPGKNFKYVAQINKAVNTHTRTVTHTHTYTLTHTRQSTLKELRKPANLVQLLLHPVQVQRNFEAIVI